VTALLDNGFLNDIAHLLNVGWCVDSNGSCRRNVLAATQNTGTGIHFCKYIASCSRCFIDTIHSTKCCCKAATPLRIILVGQDRRLVHGAGYCRVRKGSVLDELQQFLNGLHIFRQAQGVMMMPSSGVAVICRCRNQSMARVVPRQQRLGTIVGQERLGC
jgi:hypothetical protein